MNRLSLVFALVTGLVLSTSSRGEGDLKVGDRCPKLTIKKWVKGKEVKPHLAKDDRVYVVEFWATWCGPCKVSIPHISEMQEKWKDRDVVFVGISNEKLPTVEKFLHKDGWDKKMRYTVAVDKANTTSREWLEAANQNGIPCAFVIKSGKVEYIGHPMADMDLKIAELCGDDEYAQSMRKAKELEAKFTAAESSREWEEAIDLIDEIVDLAPQKYGELGRKKFEILAREMEEKDDALDWVREMIENCEDAAALNEVAWKMLVEKEYKHVRNVKVAKAAAKRAVELSDKSDAASMDTYARALADGGDYKAAIKWQQLAIEANKDPNQRDGLKKSLRKYRDEIARQADSNKGKSSKTAKSSKKRAA